MSCVHVTDEVIGRDEELAALAAFLDERRPGEGPSALVCQGEAGIGKSTLWLAGVAAARGRGLRVLSSRPAEAERALVHAALGDLFDGVLDEVLPELTAPRRRALEIALLVDDPAGRAVDPRAVGVAVRSALQRLARDDFVVLAIDDVQWLDASSANALAFALRRLEGADILLLLTRRVGEGADSSIIEEAVEANRIGRVRVGPLSLGAIHQLLHGRLARTFGRPTLLRVHEVSGGNPFYALELGRAAGAAAGDPTQPLLVPALLEELVRARLAGFSDSTRAALALASAHARLSPAQLGAAGVGEDALDPAFAEQVVELVDGAVHFTHPLLASVLYQGLVPGERRRVHRLLAQVVDEPLARARHLALATERPDPEIAASLERAAEAASVQGAPTVAAELGEHALRLTPADAVDELNRRSIAAARSRVAAGDVERGRLLARELLARARPGAERADALMLVGDEAEDVRAAIALFREALDEAAEHPALQVLIRQRLSLYVRFTEGLEAAEDHARVSVQLAERLDDDELRAVALAGLAKIRFNAGKPDALQLAERGAAFARVCARPKASVDAAFGLAHVLVWSFQLRRARAVLEDIQRDWGDRDERTTAEALWYLALVELRAGRLSLAAEYAEQSKELRAQYEHDEPEAPQPYFGVALVAAHRGQLDLARAAAEQGCRLAGAQGMMLAGLVGTRGLVEQWSGDAPAAVEHFAAAEKTAADAGWAEPALYWWRADYVEALLQLGSLDEAVALLDVWETDARRLDRAWVLVETTRCRGLVAAARGETDASQSLLVAASVGHEDVGDPFGRARALLALGIVRLNARQKREAREAMEAALAGFCELEASGWAEKARAELARIGGRTRIDGLTPAETRVADLVGRGHTNAEVAHTLFLAERTVASHLTHIYAKLGVRSRTELARRL
jgi:DNA-binding CsgD family transcriptional regulator